MKTYLSSFRFPTPDREWDEIVLVGSPEFKMTCFNNIYPFKILPRSKMFYSYRLLGESI